MIKCDTIKIKTYIQHLLNKLVHFNIQYNQKTGKPNGYVYNSKNDDHIPFNLYIATNCTKQTLTLEFSSKILYDDYPKLITKDTLPQCLKNINKLGICTIDVDAILQTGCVTGSDITEDMPFALDEEILQSLNRNVKGYRRFNWIHYVNKGITFSKDVIGRSKESIKFYDKSKEITATAQNRKFLSTLTNEQEVKDYFADKTRVEISLNSQQEIRNYLQIENTYINEFFSSTANPILTQYDRIFDTTTTETTYPVTDYESWVMGEILNKYDGDLKMIRQAMKDNNCYQSNSGLSDRMAKFEQLHRLQNTEQRNHIRELRDRLVSI